MKPKVKLTNTEDEVILTVGNANAKEVIYDINSKEEKLKKLYDKGCTKTIIKGRSFKASEKTKIKRIIKLFSDTDVEFVEETEDAKEKKEEIEEVEDEKIAKRRMLNSSSKLGLHAIKSTFESEINTSQTKFIHGNLRSGQREEFVGSIVILGDLNYGAEAVAGENIIVTGTIRGLAHAGANGNKKAIIAGHYIDCTQIRIANIVKEVRNTDGKLPFVYLENDDIIIELSPIKNVNDMKNE